MTDDPGSRFNPMNWPDHLRQYRSKDPDGDSAREIHDPHQWEDPDPGRLERIKPATTAQWLGLIAGLLFFGGLFVYLYPVFGSVYRNPIALGGLTIVAWTLVVYLIGRQHGIQAYVDLVKSIIYYGDSVDVRLGEKVDERGGRTLFSPYVNLSWGGYSSRSLLKRDLPYDASKLRSRTTTRDETGEEPVVDRLNATTVETETETLGTVLVTHASDLEYDEFGRYSDRYTPLPNRIDRDVVESMNRLIDSLQQQIRTLRSQKDMLSDANADLRDLREQQTIPQLEETVRLMVQMRDIISDKQSKSTSIDVDGVGEELREEAKEAIDA